MGHSCREASRASLSWAVTRIFVVAVLVNYPWERAHSVLYVGKDETSIPWWHCLLMSLGDGLLVLLIFFTGWVIFGRPEWFEHPGIRGYVLMLVAGLAISISVEWATVRVLGWWAYTPEMPLMPGLGLGITSHGWRDGQFNYPHASRHPGVVFCLEAWSSASVQTTRSR